MRAINTDTKTLDQSSSLPLFYKDPVLLQFQEHGEVGLTPGGDFCFAREAIAIPLSSGEFTHAMRHFPIVFAMDDQASPIALVAIRKGDNLFIEQDGSWKTGCYVPAYVRRYPFISMEVDEGAQQLLSIDRASDRFVPSVKGHANAERLFDASGNATMAAQTVMAFCHAFHTDYSNTVAFGRALIAAKVLEPFRADFRLPDGTLHQVNGFYAVNEARFRVLADATVVEWHAKGWLGLVALHLASLQSLQNLLDLNALRANERKALA